MREYRRAHPITIIFNLRRVYYLVIIPIVRGLVSVFSGGFSAWVRGAWLDITIFVLMLAIAVLFWISVRFRHDANQIEIHLGIVARKKIFIPWKNVTTVTLFQAFYLRPLRALRFHADTIGGDRKNPDFSIFLSETQANSIIDSQKSLDNGILGNPYQPTMLSIVALSLLTSNSFGGMLLISAFISQAGKILGNGFSNMLIGAFEDIARTLAFGMPPAAAAIAYILIAGWFIGFLLSFTRYKNFTLAHNNDTLRIISGIFTRRKYFIRRSDINFIDIRQSVTTKLLRLYSLYISAVGYGKRKDDISCIIPVGSEADFERRRNEFFPAMIPAPRELIPERKALPRFIGEPLFCLFAIAFAILVFVWLFPLWSVFIRFAGLMAAVPAIFFLIVRAIEYKTGGLALSNGNFILRYSKGLSLHTVVIPAGKVVRIEIRQGVLQKYGKYCDLIIGTRAEGHSLHCCRGLVKSDIVELFNL